MEEARSEDLRKNEGRKARAEAEFMNGGEVSRRALERRTAERKPSAAASKSMETQQSSASSASAARQGKRKGMGPGGAVRGLWPSENPLYEAHLKRAGVTDRDFGAQGLRASEGGYAIGWFARGRLRGAAAMAMASGPSGLEASVSLTVEPKFRGAGVARALLRRAVLNARNHNAGAVLIKAANQDPAAERLAEGLGLPFRPCKGGIRSTLPSEARTAFSLMRETMAEDWGLLRWAAGRLLRAPEEAAQPSGASSQS